MYSHSKISTFEQCPLKFKFRYIDKIIPEVEKSIEAHLGTSVHNALEWLYIKVKEGYVPTIDEFIEKYTIEWEKDYNDAFVIVKTELNSQDYFNKGVEFLVNYYMQHKPFDDNTIDVEKRIIISLDERGDYKLQGYIDRLAYNIKSREYEVHDYKTTNSMPSKEQLQRDRQLALYSIAVKELFGKTKRVRLVWHFLAHNKKVEIKKTDQELFDLKSKTLKKIKEIESTIDFPHNKSVLCDWCEYKNYCPAWGNSVESPELPKPKDKKNDLDRYPTLKKYLRKE